MSERRTRRRTGPQVRVPIIGPVGWVSCRIAADELLAFGAAAHERGWTVSDAIRAAIHVVIESPNLWSMILSCEELALPRK